MENTRNTNYFFTPGKLTFLLDGGAGSSGKGKMASFIMKHADNWTFACNTFFPQASHTVVDDGISYIYKQLNSCAHFIKGTGKVIYIGQGSVISLEALKKELEMTGLDNTQVKVHPMCGIVQDIDRLYEEGKLMFDGETKGNHSGTIKKGSTCSGVGATRARKALRHPKMLYAGDIDWLQPYLCDVEKEITTRLMAGESGLCEIAQGYQLSVGLTKFKGFTTSRNCTVAAALDDMMLPPAFAGNVVINFRTFPIRIHSNKYLSTDGSERHMTWQEVQDGEEGVDYTVIESPSGPGYEDQEEISWDELTALSGSPEPTMECTTLTKLPRRVFTFSVDNLLDSILANFPTEGHKVFIAVNFINYLDNKITDSKDNGDLNELTENWIGVNIRNPLIGYYAKADRIGDKLLLGTGADTESVIVTDL